MEQKGQKRTKERVEAIRKMRNAGMSYSEIARAIGITSQAVQQLVKRYELDKTLDK